MTCKKPDDDPLDLVAEYEQALADADEQLLHELMQSIDDLMELLEPLQPSRH